MSQLHRLTLELSFLMILSKVNFKLGFDPKSSIQGLHDDIVKDISSWTNSLIQVEVVDSGVTLKTSLKVYTGVHIASVSVRLPTL
jgi:hypothetical protein